jgi:hypothetical protein
MRNPRRQSPIWRRSRGWPGTLKDLEDGCGGEIEHGVKEKRLGGVGDLRVLGVRRRL